MKKQLALFAVLFGVCCIFLSTPVHASYSLSFSPGSQEVGVSGSTSVDVIATVDAGESFDWFGMNITYFDVSVVEASFVTPAAPFTLYSPVDYYSDPPNGIVSIFASTTAEQSGTVTLATITFQAKDTGTATLGFGTTVFIHDFYGENKTGLQASGNGSGSITVSKATVPEPATFLLLGFGFLALGVLRKKI